MAIILVKNPGNPVGQRHHISGADAQGNVTWSETESDSLVFVDAAAATAFSSGKSIMGAVQVTVTGRKNLGQKSANQ